MWQLDGPNNLQNYPVLTAATVSAEGTTIEGTLNSTPNTEHTVQFFSSDACDPSGFGEGQRLVGTIPVTTDANCNAIFSLTVPTVLTGQVITGTATAEATPLSFQLVSLWVRKSLRPSSICVSKMNQQVHF